ncbi:MAG: hypothetical protein IPM34_05785 [Saprospiraceae bacterium]|nr:hypothetical protein [Saprospiraceae bacterium]
MNHLFNFQDLIINYFQIKKCIVLFCLLISSIIFSNSVNGQQRIDVTMTVAGEIREFIVFKPSGGIPVGGYPLVFMLHGTNQDGLLFYNHSQWKEIAEKEKFIVVFPTALVYCTTEGTVTKWSHGNTASVLCPGDTLRSDLPFFYKMIDTIATTLPINLKKVFATGFSSGGTMVPKLSIDMPGVFAAIGCGSGNLDDRDSFPMNPKVPTWAIRGTHDHNFIDRLGRPCPFNDSALLYNANNLKNHLGSMGLTNQYSKDSAEYAIHYTFTKTLPGEAPAFFRWSIYHGLEHEYFNGSNYLSNLSNPPVEAELFWEFFKRSVTVDVQDEREQLADLKIFPNPSIEFVQVKVGEKIGNCLWSIQDPFGRMLHKGKSSENQELIFKKSDYGRGLFLLIIQTEKSIVTGKIYFE